VNARTVCSAFLVTVLGTGAAALHAQAVDRTTPPELGPPPSVTLPAIAKQTLPNGLELYVVEMHEVPVVQFILSIPGGGLNDGTLPGLASFTAGMMDEGAAGRDAIGIAAQAAYLGATLNTGADWNALTASLKVPRRTMSDALDLMADVVLHPTFDSAEVVRQRDLRLAAILQRRDSPNAVAAIAFSALAFPNDHAYHHPLSGDSASTATLDSATVRAYYDAHVRPGGARMIVTGDITPTEARLAVARRFREWASGESPPAPVPESGPVMRATTIYLVDKPEAAQSVIRIGGPGVERTNPDYYAIAVMNTILGGSFSSRLNSILREEKGYTYGAGSGFQFDPVPGPFVAGSSVRTNVTDSSLVILFQQLHAIRDMPVEPVELDRAKAYLALGLADQFETTGQMAGQVNELLTFGLPLRYYDDYVDRIMAVTTKDVQRVAKKYLTPDQYTAVVVGDVAAIRGPIEALHLAPVAVVDMFGAPVE